jgi:hypothetical protein
MDSESVVPSDGDRFDDIVENVKLSESLKHVLHYVNDIANNDKGDLDAQSCVTVLESMQRNVNDEIGEAIA